MKNVETLEKDVMLTLTFPTTVTISRLQTAHPTFVQLKKASEGGQDSQSIQLQQTLKVPAVIISQPRLVASHAWPSGRDNWMRLLPKIVLLVVTG